MPTSWYIFPKRQGRAYRKRADALLWECQGSGRRRWMTDDEAAVMLQAYLDIDEKCLWDDMYAEMVYRHLSRRIRANEHSVSGRAASDALLRRLCGMLDAHDLQQKDEDRNASSSDADSVRSLTKPLLRKTCWYQRAQRKN